MPPPLPELEGVAHRYELVNGIRIHYAEAGDGPPLVLLHGWPQHWWMWREQIRPLAEQYRVIVPDLRGHGWSDKPRSSYLKTELLDDVLKLIDQLGLGPLRLVGHDWGAYVGLLAALHEPQRLVRFVAMSIPHPWQRRRPDPRMVARGWYQLVVGGPLGRVAMKRLGFARLVLEGGRKAGSYNDEELAAYAEVFRDDDAASATVHLYRSFLLRELRTFASGELGSRRLTVPTLWLIGDGDPLAKVADDGYRDHADDMTLEFLPGAGHFLPEELPMTVLERIRAFL